MSAPVAVSPSNPRPGLHLAVDLLRGSTSPGSLGLRALLASPPETGQGDITVGTEIRPVFSKENVATAIGRGPGYFAWKALFANDRNAMVELAACAASAGATASGALTFGGTPTEDSAWLVTIMGVEIEVEWAVGVTDDDAATAGAARINTKGDDLMVVASADEADIDLDCRVAGTFGNDITLTVKKLRGTGATLTASGAKLTGGTTEVDYTTVLSTAQVKEYDFILLCMSNADAQSASSSSNPARLETHIDGLNTGSNAKLQQGIYASTGTRSAAQTNTVARNSTILEHVCSQNDRSLPCEVAAAELGDRMRRRRQKPNANRVNQPLRGLKGSANPVAEIPTDTEFEACANAGLTVIGYTANNDPMLMRSITTYHQDTLGKPDRRCFDTAEVDGIYDYVKDLRTFLPQEYQTPDNQVNVMRDRVPGDEPLPEGTVEERDIKASIVGRTLSFWVPKGVIDGAVFQAAVDSGELIVAINASDETQVDIFIPAKCFKILAKMSLFVAKVG